MKLSGWKRIGIVASILWILGAGAHTYDSEMSSSSDMIASIHVECDSNLAGMTGEDRTAAFDKCNKEAEDSLARALTNARLTAAFIAFVPVPLGWGFAYLILFAIRWIRRGF
jgi:hypothetical protein